MPLYAFFCEHCNGEVEVLKGMNDPSPKRCPACGCSRFHRIYGQSVAFHGSCDEGWEQENDGLGKWMPQLGARYLDAHTRTKKNPDAYARSRAEAIEKFQKRGYNKSDISKA